MKGRLLLGLAALLVVCALGAGTAVAAPPRAVGQVTSEAFGGHFLELETVPGYFCLGGLGNPFSQGQLTAAATVCERAQGGTFFYPGEFSNSYFCAAGLGT